MSTLTEHLEGRRMLLRVQGLGPRSVVEAVERVEKGVLQGVLHCFGPFFFPCQIN